MSRVVTGNIIGIPNPVSDWEQTNPNRADYIKNKPEKLVNTINGKSGTVDLSASDVNADQKGSADEALSSAKAYTDEQIAAIPTPDVSGQISSHDTSNTSHNDIRLLIDNLNNSKLNTEDLYNAISEALMLAKNSGEFDGKDGITPQIRINSVTNYWEVSTDNGVTWTSTNVAATGQDGVSIAKIEINNNGELVITLSDNTIFNLGVLPSGSVDEEELNQIYAEISQKSQVQIITWEEND